MQRNPNAPTCALALEELQPGMQVVIVKGGGHWHETVTIASKPYTTTSPVPHPQHVGQMLTVQFRWVKVQGVSSVERAQAYLITGSRGPSVEEKSLADMGLAPNWEGQWSLAYTLRVQDYDARRNPYYTHDGTKTARRRP